MSINLPFKAVERLLFVDDWVLNGTTGISNIPGTFSGNSQKENNNSNSGVDSSECPILAPQPVPNLLLDHDLIESSREKLENFWNTSGKFPTTSNKQVCCIYCSIPLLDFVDDVEVNRWFVPTRREKKVTFTIDEDEISHEVNESSFVYSGYGIFCTYYCTNMYLRNKKMLAEESMKGLKLLDLLYKDCYGSSAPVIGTPVVKEHLTEYGGFLTRYRYKNHAFSYEK